jgi:small-conductance mechanosensitive channel/CRP-like cAMP-binding protein
VTTTEDPLWMARAWLPFILGAAVVVVAYLVGQFARHRRLALRRTLVLFGAYVVTIGLVTAASWTASPRAVFWAQLASGVAEFLLLVNLTALLVFDLALPALGLRLASIVSDVVIGAAYLLGLLVGMHRLGVNISGLVATSAVVTAVIGLSLQATLGNILGGLALQLDDSINVGDWIEMENKTQGRVRQIRWRHTVIETRDWDAVIVPNSVLLGQAFRILGKRDGEPAQHRMWVYFNVDFRFHPSEVIRVVNEALQSTPIDNVAAKPAAHCICYEFGTAGHDSVAQYAVRYWLTDLAVDAPTNSVVRTRVYAALQRAGIPLALPAAAILMQQDDPESQKRKLERQLGERMATVRGVELFASLTEEEKAKIASRLRFAPFSPGEVMTRQGAVAHWLYILAKGQALVRVEGKDGGAESVATISAPSFFGEMSLMTGAPRAATVLAVTDVLCYRIDKDDFHEVVSHRPEVAREISEVLAARSVALRAARENLDAEARLRHMDDERGRLLAAVEEFFGLREAKA